MVDVAQTKRKEDGTTGKAIVFQSCPFCLGYIAGKTPKHLLAHIILAHSDRPVPDFLKELERELSAEGEEAKDRIITSLAYPVDFPRDGMEKECTCSCHEDDNHDAVAHIGPCCIRCPYCDKRIPGAGHNSLFCHIVEKHPVTIIPRDLQYLAEITDQ